MGTAQLAIREMIEEYKEYARKRPDNEVRMNLFTSDGKIQLIPKDIEEIDGDLIKIYGYD